MSFLLSAWWLWLVVMCTAGLWVIRYKSEIDTLIMAYAAKGDRKAVALLERFSKWKIRIGTAVTVIACVLFAVSMCICVGNIMM